MARPKEPLIHRDEVFDAALEILDRNGIDGLSMRSLAAVLEVNAASLYHHFANKDEILEGVAKLVLDADATALDRDQDWKEQLVTLWLGAFDALVAHPNIAPVLIRRSDRHFEANVHNYAARIVREAGVPPALVLPLLDSMEALLLGSAIFASKDLDAVPYPADDGQYAALREVLEAEPIDIREQAELAVRALIEGWTVHILRGAGDEARRQGRRRLRR